MPEERRVAAVDLGATSGRVMVGTVGAGRLDLEEVHRFGNGPVTADDGSLRWDIHRLHDEVLAGLREAGPVDAIGIDAWAVDYGLLDAAGELLAEPFCYRDARTDRVRATVDAAVPAAELYSVTGIQHLPFNTIYQLAAEADLSPAASMLLVPDLLGYWLTGAQGAEATNASTTQLYDVRRGEWAVGLPERVDVPPRLLPPLRRPGDVVGTLRTEAAAATGLDVSTPVVAVGSHDTASAVVAVPFGDARRAAYISSGTWSLVGVELDAPVLTDAAREANFTNEGGVDGTTRFLRNVMGLWVLGELLREWGTDDVEAALVDAEASAPGPVVDVDAPEFLAPGPMQHRLKDACRVAGHEPPSSRGGLVRLVLESLADAYRRAVGDAERLSGVPVDVVHVVGGGARNDLLCRLTADACGVPVLAGPVEATALGNVLVQARALGADLPDLGAMRALVAATHDVVRHEPRIADAATVSR
ncbi:MAG: rhamnulokinase [Nocardioidaceae bacterium]|nr:rhamnulokinase [Nocardioidaceae bacterium]